MNPRPGVSEIMHGISWQAMDRKGRELKILLFMNFWKDQLLNTCATDMEKTRPDIPTSVSESIELLSLFDCIGIKHHCSENIIA